MTEDDKRPQQPLPGAQFVRPGIDDRPDYEKVLSPEEKEAIARLAVPMPAPKGSGVSSQTGAGVQATRMTAESMPVAAVARVDAAVPDMDSAFLDMRDPMASADGHVPTRTEVIRLGVGFVVCALVCAIPWVALTSLVLPAVLEQIDAGSKEMMLGIINICGSIVALVANILFGTLSDLTRIRFGKRTPWIIAGGLIAGASMGLISTTHSFPLILIFWCTAQLGYNVMLAPFVATMSDRVPDKFRGTISGFYGAGIAAGQTLGNLVGASLLDRSNGIWLGWMMGFAVFSLIGIITVAIWPREKSSLRESHEPFSAGMLVRSLRFPRNAPDFYYALSGRTLMMGGYWMLYTYLLYIATDYIYAGNPDAGTLAPALIARMAVITLVVSLIAALGAGPIADAIGRRKVPVALSSVLFAIGAAMPLLLPNAWGMYLFAGISGLGYGTYNAIDQALNVAVLPNPEEAGKDLGILNLANTLSTVIGSAATSLIVATVKQIMGVQQTPAFAYTIVLCVSIAVVLIAAWLIMRIKSVK